MYIHQSVPVPWRVLRLWERAALNSPLRRGALPELVARQGKPRARLIAVGDISLARPPSYDARVVFEALLPLLAAADIRTGNLEGLITSREAPAARLGSQLRASPSALPIVADAGFDVLSVANNHALDYGSGALADALSLLGTRKIDACGVAAPDGRARLVVRTVNSLRIGFLAFCDDHAGIAVTAGEPRPSLHKREATLADVAAARRKVDVLIVQMHWGYEFSLHPLLRHRNDARSLVEAGASAVICHHAHVPQGIEIWRGCPIAYGLGNAVCSMSPYMRAGHQWTDRSYALELGLCAEGVNYARMHPFGIRANGQLLQMPVRQRRAFLAALVRMSRRLDDDDFLQRLEHARMLYEASQLVPALKGASAAGDEELTERAIALTLSRQQLLIEHLSKMPELAPLALALAEIGACAPRAARIRIALDACAAMADQSVAHLRGRYHWQDTLRSRVP